MASTSDSLVEVVARQPDADILPARLRNPRRLEFGGLAADRMGDADHDVSMGDDRQGEACRATGKASWPAKASRSRARLKWALARGAARCFDPETVPLARKQIVIAIAAVGLAAACSSGDGTRPSGRAGDDRGLPARSGPIDRDAGQRDAPRHALVVGGTGMLRPVSLELARRGFTTSVIARNRGPLDDMARESGGRIHPIALDYRHTDELVRALDRSVTAHGPIVLVVAWIHEVAPDAPLVVARTAAAGGHRVDYFHVVGSAADDPSQPEPRRWARFAGVAGIEYHEVILGFVLEGSSSRWLTDDEIAAGVLDAIDLGAPRSIVGTTRPWSARP